MQNPGVFDATQRANGDTAKLANAAQALDQAANGAISSAVGNGDISGKAGSTLLLQSVPGVAAQRVLLVGCGAEKDYGNKVFASAMTAAFKALKSTAATDVTIPLETRIAVG